MNYKIIRDGEIIGPFTAEELSRMGISPDTYVWREGLSEWVTAANLTELAACLSQPLPPPVEPTTPVETDVEADAETEPQPSEQQPDAQQSNEENASEEDAPETDFSSIRWWSIGALLLPCIATIFNFGLQSLLVYYLFCVFVIPPATLGIVFDSISILFRNKGKAQKALDWRRHAKTWTVVACILSGIVTTLALFATDSWLGNNTYYLEDDFYDYEDYDYDYDDYDYRIAPDADVLPFIHPDNLPNP